MLEKKNESVILVDEASPSPVSHATLLIKMMIIENCIVYLLQGRCKLTTSCTCIGTTVSISLSIVFFFLNNDFNLLKLLYENRFYCGFVILCNLKRSFKLKNLAHQERVEVLLWLTCKLYINCFNFPVIYDY